MAWTIELTEAAEKALGKLDRQAANRIVAYLREVEQLDDPRSRGKGMTAGLAGFWRYRVGDYRLICEIQDGLLRVLVLRVGHRSRVYD